MDCPLLIYFSVWQTDMLSRFSYEDIVNIYKSIMVTVMNAYVGKCLLPECADLVVSVQQNCLRGWLCLIVLI